MRDEPLTVSRIGIYDEFEKPFPPSRLKKKLESAADIDAVIIDNNEDLHSCDAVLTKTHRDVYTDTVDWVHTFRSGYDDFPLNEYSDNEVTLTNSTGAQGNVVGETVLGYMLMFARGLLHYSQQDSWNRLSWQQPFVLENTSLSIVGLGQLGTNVATRAANMGMKVNGVDIRPVSALGIENVFDINNVTSALHDSRFVVLTTPLTPQTNGLIGKSELEEMRDDAFLINVSRGEIIEEDALVAALESDEIAGAALDVFQEEPLPDDSPLWEMDNVIVTPHIAAHANHYVHVITDLVTTNVERLEDGQQPWNHIV